MPRAFELAAEYEGSVAQVYRAFSDERYWLARLEASGADETKLEAKNSTSGGGLDVITTQTLHADRLPGVVSQFHHGDLSFVREETWGPIVDGSASAVVKGSIPGAPATLDGTALLSTAGDGARLEFKATVEVRIPLVGGKVESFIGSQLTDLLRAEQRFTTEWIRQHS